MKNFQFFAIALFISIILFACGQDELTSEGTEYLLVEALISPGSIGSFEPVTSSKTITLFADSTFISNGDVCIMNIETSQGSAGSFDFQQLLPDSCTTNEFGVRYELSGDELILSYLCIEPCRHKYKRK